MSVRPMTKLFDLEAARTVNKRTNNNTNIKAHCTVSTLTLSVSCVNHTLELIYLHDVSVGVLRGLNLGCSEAIFVFLWYSIVEKTTLKAHLINLDLVITNVLKYFWAILNFTVLLPYFWNCLCLVFVFLYIIFPCTTMLSS